MGGGTVPIPTNHPITFKETRMSTAAIHATTL
ncbi:MAG: hypothetical protein QOD57_2479, partial [Actinomycetota bacterium]|nr:hypothetical protein [Actinomycetota bacterium]